MIYLIIPLILIFLGYGILILLLPKSLKSYSLFLAPWIGASIIIILGLSLNMNKLRMSDFLFGGAWVPGYQFILLLGAMLFIDSIILKTKEALLINKHDWLIIMVPVLAFITNSVIAGFKAQQITSLTAVLNHTSLVDTMHITFTYPEYYQQIGLPLILSFFSAIFNTINMSELLHVIQSTYIAFTVPLLFFLYKGIQKKWYKHIDMLMSADANLFIIALLLVAITVINLVFFVTLVAALALISLYFAITKKRIGPIIQYGKIILLLLLMNPVGYGLIIKLINI